MDHVRRECILAWGSVSVLLAVGAKCGKQNAFHAQFGVHRTAVSSDTGTEDNASNRSAVKFNII
jgi:hypothetical protein